MSHLKFMKMKKIEKNNIDIKLRMFFEEIAKMINKKKS